MVACVRSNRLMASTLRRNFRGNPEERVMSFQDGEVLGKQKGGVVVREGFLEEVPPELDLEI